jgi:dTDP-4-dehydrorhamnose reductase
MWGLPVSRDYTRSVKWVVIGASGLLGSTALQYLKSHGAEARGIYRATLDFQASTSEIVDKIGPADFILNAVGYTKVDQAEIDADDAFFANATVPQRLAEVAEIAGSRLIQISTDFVFDGAAGRPYLPNDDTNPLSVYATTKLLGEQAALSYSNSNVVRTAWLYGRNGDCFPKRIAEKLRQGGEVHVVDDQFGSPTHAVDVAAFISHLSVTPTDERILHAVSTGEASWYQFALEIARKIGSGSVLPIKSSSLSQAAPRPPYSVLESTRLGQFEMPEWRAAWASSWSQVIGAN